MDVVLLGALVSAAAFGTANVVIKKSLGDNSLRQTVTFAMLSATAFLFAYVLINRGSFDVSSGNLTSYLALGLVEACLYMITYKAFAVSNVTVASAILAGYPLFTTIFAILILGESISAQVALGIFTIVIGAVLVGVDLKQLGNGLQPGDVVKGLPWILLSLMMHVIYFPLLGEFTATGDWSAKLLGIKLVSLIVIIVVVLGVLRSKRNSIIPQRKTWPYLALLGFLEVMGFASISYTSNGSVGQIAIIVALGSLSPVFTALLAYIFLKERLRILQYLGILVVIAGVVLISV